MDWAETVVFTDVERFGRKLYLERLRRQAEPPVIDSEAHARVATMLRARLERLVADEFLTGAGVPASSGAAPEARGLTVQEVVEGAAQVNSPLYYGESHAVAPGTVVYCASPEFIMLHPDDVARWQVESPRPLVPLRDRVYGEVSNG